MIPPLLLCFLFAIFTLSTPVAAVAAAHWSVTYAYSGTSTNLKNGQGSTVPWPPNGPPLPPPSQTFTAGNTVYLQMQGTITATMRWVDDNGNPTTDPPPPEEVFVIRWANAWWNYSVEDGSVTVTQHVASDGLGHPEVPDIKPASGSGVSAGTQILQVNGASGTVVLPVVLNATLALTCTAGFNGSAQAGVNYAVTLSAPADDYHFTYALGSNPPGTVPFGQTAADYQDGPLADGTGYYVAGRVYTNQTAQHALTQLRETAVFFVFGHGGSLAKACQTFWNGQWTYMVRTEGAFSELTGPPHNVPPDRIVVLDRETGRPFERVLLVVFAGCYTAWEAPTWGSPTHGVVAKGADCALGFTGVIRSHVLNPEGTVQTPGAEEWAERFWERLCVRGETVLEAASRAAQGIPFGQGLGNRACFGNGAIKIHPARYGQ